VGAAKEIDDGTPILEKIAHLNSILEQCFIDSSELNERIRTNLNKIMASK
jgi:hypothetical protein